jgi:radical SAM protein with 4Fe4S-binding SPASM domain
MEEKNITGRSAPTGTRIKLADALPLDVPLVVQIFHIYACNLSCRFCHYGLPKAKRPFLTSKKIMDMALFKKCIDDMADFAKKLKLLRFCGTGESLLDKNIVEMVRYAAKRRVADVIELITNATLLTHEVSTALIEAGLSRLRVSIYGVSASTYKELCGADIDFDRILDNVGFFYKENVKLGGKTTVYIKTMDCALKDKEEETRFIELFGDHCDIYSVELVRPNVPGIDYSAWLEEERPAENASGIKLPIINVCPQPFHLLTICPDGRVMPCTCDFMTSMGQCADQSLKNIWLGDTLRRFQRSMLDGSANAGDICKQCSIVQCRPFPEDILDHDVERLKSIYD